MTFIEATNKIIALVTIGGQIVSLLLILNLVFWRKKHFGFMVWIKRHSMALSFLVALGATAGSLYYSQYVGFPPCDLCWLQRVFMYPSVVFLLMALLKKDVGIIDYVLSLSVIGFVISLYHNYMYFFDQGLSLNCSILGSSVSCVKRYVFEFGYVTIPVMALTAFALLIIFLVFAKLQQSSHGESR